jgi:asparagine synthetase B (glutamine-hydrolysing)
LIGRLRAVAPRPAGTSYAQLSIYEQFVNGWMAHVMEQEDRGAAQAGIEELHPYYDLRLIEFCFAIPEDQREGSHHIKYVLRNAMKGLLPESIRTRTTKAELSKTVMRLLDRVGGANFFDHLTIADKGWVDSDLARKTAHETLGSYSGSNFWTLLNTFSIEVWYNTVFHDGGDLLSRVAPSPAASPQVLGLPRGAA